VIGFAGELISPHDDRYAAARTVWNGAIDRYPALIARAHGTDDVIAVIRHARETGLSLSIRGGGHSAAGLAVADGGIMLDLSAMKAVEVDPASRVAVAGPGLCWAELDAATHAHGLATTGSVVGSTGIAGLTLGGGIGRMDRLAGLTCDNLLRAEVVTADGGILRTSPDEHPDLFWALRGGGGNFGVVTSFTYRLHPVAGVYGGILGYPFNRAADVLRAYAEFSEYAPDRLAVYVALAAAPSAPFVPEPVRGQRVAVLLPLYFGPADEGPQALAPLRSLLPGPVVDITGPMSYEQSQRLSDAVTNVELHHYDAVEWLSQLDGQAIDELVTVTMAAAELSPGSMVSIKRMGGMVAQVPPDQTAFWYRNAAHSLHIDAQWTPGDDPARHIAWAGRAWRAAQHVSAGGGYVNFLAANADADRIRSAYGGNYARLTEVKAAYDPSNFFRINHNIEPVQTRQRSGAPGAGS